MQYSRLSPVFVLLLMLSIALYYNVQISPQVPLTPVLKRKEQLDQPQESLETQEVVNTELHVAPRNIEGTLRNVTVNSKEKANDTHNVQQELPKTGDLVSVSNVSKTSDSKKAPKSTKGTCQPHLNVAFLKAHKCASTTVSHVIFRFGHEHNLLVALPAKTDCDIIGHFGVIRDEDYEPPPGGRRWNLFTHHAMYNRTRFRQLMDPDTRYITILRDPLQRLQSAFQYHKFETRFPGMKNETANGTAYITTYLKKPSFWDPLFNPHENIIDRENFCFRNCMSRDLGLLEKDYDNHTAIQEFVQGIENDFTTVMIMEYLPESLVLLKRRMCWTLRDILYESASWVKKSTYSLQSVFTREMVENFERHNHADVVLHARFKELFLEQIKEEGDGFKEEVKHFNRVNDEVFSFCAKMEEWKRRRPKLSIKKSKFSDAFVVDKHFCLGYYLRRWHWDYVSWMEYQPRTTNGQKINRIQSYCGESVKQKRPIESLKKVLKYLRIKKVWK